MSGWTPKPAHLRSSEKRGARNSIRDGVSGLAAPGWRCRASASVLLRCDNVVRESRPARMPDPSAEGQSVLRDDRHGGFHIAFAAVGSDDRFQVDVLLRGVDDPERLLQPAG